jgi:hypothetical protein
MIGLFFDWQENLARWEIFDLIISRYTPQKGLVSSKYTVCILGGYTCRKQKHETPKSDQKNHSQIAVQRESKRTLKERGTQQQSQK